MNLMPVEKAQDRLLALAAPLPVEHVALLAAMGRYLAEPVVAGRDQPWADLSAMDGYAIRYADMPGPWRVSGESRAGGTAPNAIVAPGDAMRIFTGAPLPDGTDTILIQEATTVAKDGLHLCGDGPARFGESVRRRASDFASGDVLLEAGTQIGTAQVALAAMAGHASIAVRRRPRVAILSTGDELTPVGTMAGPGQIPASNGVMLQAMLAQAGAEVIDLGLVPDKLEAIAYAFRSMSDADIIVSTGGASVGDHDLVAPAIEAAGGTLDFWRIAVKPGKPLMAGRIGEACVVGLPGNPISAFVTATLFLLPLVRHMAGARRPLPAAMSIPTDFPLVKGGSRTEYLRGRVEGGRLVWIGDRDSAALRTLAKANALVERPVDAAPAAVGDTLRVLMFAA